MLQNILLAANILVCIALIVVVLLQRSEGGALGMGGGPSGFMTARGAGDLLTRITWILFTIFLALSLAMTVFGGGPRSITDSQRIQAIDPSKLNQPPALPSPTTPGSAPAGVPGLLPGAQQTPLSAAPATQTNTLPPLTAAPQAPPTVTERAPPPRPVSRVPALAPVVIAPPIVVAPAETPTDPAPTPAPTTP